MDSGIEKTTGLPQKQWEEILDVSGQSISKWEFSKGKDTIPFPRWLLLNQYNRRADNKKKRYASH